MFSDDAVLAGRVTRPKNGPVPPGFTLIEVLLVLAVMAAVAALSWPVIQRQFENYRLRTAADMIRTEWCKARIEAMRTSTVYTFRRSADGNHFFTQASATEVSAAQPGTIQAPSAQPASSTAAPTTTAPGAAPAEPAARRPGEKVLPDGVEFSAAQVAPDSSEADLEALDGAADATEPDWSDPIFFYPDGTTSDAQLKLKNDHGREVEINLRGLTGTVEAGDVLSVEE